MAFGITEIGALIGLGATAVGAVTSFSGARSQARAIEGQGAFSLQASQEQAKAAEELAALEASLFLQQGASSQEIADANAALSEQNAAMEGRAGLIALSQARRVGEARVSSMVKSISRRPSPSKSIPTRTLLAP